MVFSWSRCSRGDADGWEAADAPLEHMPERYLVRIFSGVTLVRSVEWSVAGGTYSAAEQAADFGGPAPGFDFTVQQISPVFGPGHTGKGQFHG